MRESQPEYIDSGERELELLDAEDEELGRIQQRDQLLGRYLDSCNLRSIEPVWQESEDIGGGSTFKNHLKRALEGPQGVSEEAMQPAQRMRL